LPGSKFQFFARRIRPGNTVHSEIHSWKTSNDLRRVSQAAEGLSCTWKWDAERRKSALPVEMRWCSMVGCNICG